MLERLFGKCVMQLLLMQFLLMQIHEILACVLKYSPPKLFDRFHFTLENLSC